MKYQNIPIVGKTYKAFFGKIKKGNSHDVKIVKVVPFSSVDADDLNLWEESLRTNWFLASETESFVYAEIKTDVYGEEKTERIFFVRTQNGGWSSLEYYHWWSDGILDVDGSLYKNL